MHIGQDLSYLVRVECSGAFKPSKVMLACIESRWLGVVDENGMSSDKDLQCKVSCSSSCGTLKLCSVYIGDPG